MNLDLHGYQEPVVFFCVSSFIQKAAIGADEANSHFVRNV